MHEPVYMIGFVVGKHFVMSASVMPSRLLAKHVSPAVAGHGVEETVTRSLRPPPSSKERLTMVAAESDMIGQSIDPQARRDIELLAREEMLIGKAEREE